MCGLAGLVTPDSTTQQHGLDCQTVRRMNDVLSHRGPDSSGFWSDEQRVALAHRRLAIQDLSPLGHQPMPSKCKRYQLVFNGEIYNFQSLKAELQAVGLTFNGHSDSEVLLASVVHWGLEEALSRFNGMFAFAIWDSELQQLTLAQDRLGKKPLYFGYIGGSLVFASELKALQQHPEFDGEICRDALQLYLEHNVVPAPFAIYQGIYKMPQASYLRCSLSDISARKCLLSQLQQYWAPLSTAKNAHSAPYTGNFDSAVDTLDEMLQASTALRLVSDVPVGVLLSGGIDSSTIASIAQSQSATPISTFSIGFNNEKTSEAAAAKAIAQHLGSNHHELYLSDNDALDVLGDIPTIFDEPFADSSQIPTYIVAKLAKQQVTVALTGDGGDELFYGYKRYFSNQKLWQLNQKLPAMLRKPIGYAAEGLAKLSGGESGLYRHAAALKADHILDVYHSRFVKFNQASKLLKDHQAIALPHLNTVKQLDLACDDMNMMLLDFTNYLCNDILVKVDRASMAASLETRNPLLDYHIVEFAWSLPQQFKYQNNQGKVVLRKVLDKYLPQQLTDRPKQGFGSPIRQWLSGALRQWADELLSVEHLRQQGIFNAEYVHQLWQACIKNPKKSHSRIWTILMFQAWHQQHCAK